MFVELVDHLRCPAAHEETWLVMAAEETRDRHVITGMLGCPVCNARYAVRGGTVWFAEAAGHVSDGPSREPGTAAAPSSASVEIPTAGSAAMPTLASVEMPTPTGPGDEWPLRLAAFLGLADARGVVGLYGAWALFAEPLGDVVDGVEVIAIAPDRPTHPMLSAIVPRSRAAIPLATGALRAVAVDLRSASPAEIAEAARLVRSGGRLLAPATSFVPEGVRELARDGEWWVGERGATPSGIVPLGVRRSP